MGRLSEKLGQSISTRTFHMALLKSKTREFHSFFEQFESYLAHMKISSRNTLAQFFGQPTHNYAPFLPPLLLYLNNSKIHERKTAKNTKRQLHEKKHIKNGYRTSLSFSNKR